MIIIYPTTYDINYSFDLQKIMRLTTLGNGLEADLEIFKSKRT